MEERERDRIMSYPRVKISGMSLVLQSVRSWREKERERDGERGGMERERKRERERGRDGERERERDGERERGREREKFHFLADRKADRKERSAAQR